MNRFPVEVLVALCAVLDVAQGIGVSGVVNTCTSSAQIRHFLTFFSRVDNNTNNVLERSDYVNTAGRLLSIYNYKKFNVADFDAPGGIVDQAWSVFPMVTMTKDMYIVAASLVSGITAVLNLKVNGLADVMFKAFDFLDDGTNTLNLEELQGEWFTFGVTDMSQSQQAFNDLDTDKDGRINKTEFVNNGICFFSTTQDNDPCRWFLGPDNYNPGVNTLISVITGGK